MTLTQKILAAHCGKDRLAVGEMIMADVDLALGNDITCPVAVKAFDSLLNTSYAADDMQ